MDRKKDSLLFVWHDKWLSKGILRSLLTGPLNKDDDRLLIRDVAKNFPLSFQKC